MRILIADALSPACEAVLSEGGLESERRQGLTEDQLVEAIPAFDGLMVRSATQVTARVLAAGKRLRAVGRAGVGVDNIDVAAATRAGIVVMNTPFGNITSAAEHALALMMALARNISDADREMKAGGWPKKGLTGVELDGKTLGVIGLGRVGAIVARVARSLGMSVLVFDPYVTDKKAAELGITRSPLDPLLETADFVSIHAPLTPETKNLLDAAKLAKMKKSARLINDARGGIIDETALAAALREGRLAGAALDVFEREPLPADSPLRSAPHLILTPHLGASTEEAQERVSVEIAKQFVEFFRDGGLRNAVNLSVPLDPRLAPWCRLASALGSLVAKIARSPASRLEVAALGRLAQDDCRSLSLSALRGFLARTTTGAVTLVNAPAFAEARGLGLEERLVPLHTGSLLTVTAHAGTSARSASGAIHESGEARITAIDGLAVDLRPEDRVLLASYTDRPGIIGRIGTLLGAADVNIATLSVGRRDKRGEAVLAVTVDEPVPAELLDRLRKEIGASEVHVIEPAS